MTCGDFVNLCVLPLVGIVNQCVLSGRRSAVAGWGCVNLRVLPHLPEGEPLCSVRAAIANYDCWDCEPSCSARRCTLHLPVFQKSIFTTKILALGGHLMRFVPLPRMFSCERGHTASAPGARSLRPTVLLRALLGPVSHAWRAFWGYSPGVRIVAAPGVRKVTRFCCIRAFSFAL